MDKSLLEQFLDDQEQTHIQNFFENERLREAVKKVLLAPLYLQGTMKKGKKANPTANWLYTAIGNTNENLGAVIRAKTEALAFIEEGFKLLSCFKKTEQTVDKKINQAR